MIDFNKSEVREKVTIDDVYDLLNEWGGVPEYTDFGLLSATICHNEPGIGSRKLYYYENSTLFHCYSGCEEPSFDIFELVIKIAAIQWHKNYDLNDAVRFIANRLGINGVYKEDEEQPLEDWKLLEKYNRIEDINLQKKEVTLKEYDSSILNRFNYSIKLTPWLNDNINQEALNVAHIGYYPGGDQITIPHFDKDGRLVGIRGRAMCKAEADLYGKYRPLYINRMWYSHPLGMNLYNLNCSKENIKVAKMAIVFESEKASLQYKSFFGCDNDIAVACCGQNFSQYHLQLLLDLGVHEIVIAFDREGADQDKKKYLDKFYRLNKKYGNIINLSFLYDKTGDYLDFKDSPTDKGADTFLYLFKNRIYI